jgi:hypothetical protein
MRLGTRTGHGVEGAVALPSLLAVAVSVAVVVAGCGATGGSPGATGSAGATGAGSSSPAGTAAATAVPGTSDAVADVQLVVLAKGSDGVEGLWTYAHGAWGVPVPVAGATALGRDGQTLVLASEGALETRPLEAVAVAGSRLAIDWPARPAGASIVAIARTKSGATAVVGASGGSFWFALSSAQGRLTELSPAPSAPFGPSLAWLDAGRLAVISADGMQIPRLAVIDTASHTLTLQKKVAGIRVFGVSPDAKTLAAATESAVLAGPVSDWMAGQVPGTVVTLKPSQVAWDLALSNDGSGLAMLSGTADAQGNVTDIHELVYLRSATGWSPVADVSVPFLQDSGQIWLS